MYIHVLWLIPIVIFVVVVVVAIMSVFCISGRESEKERMRDQIFSEPHAYIYGKQKEGVEPPVISQERMEKIRKTAAKYLEKRGVK